MLKLLGPKVEWIEYAKRHYRASLQTSCWLLFILIARYSKVRQIIHRCTYELKDMIYSKRKEFPSILYSIKQAFAINDEKAVLEAHRNKVATTSKSSFEGTGYEVEERMHCRNLKMWGKSNLMVEDRS